MVPALPASEGPEDRSLDWKREALLCCFLARPRASLPSLWVSGAKEPTLSIVKCSGSFLLWLSKGSGVHGVSSSRLEQFPSVQQGVNSPEEGMYASQAPVCTPTPIQLAEWPPSVGEGYRDHMTLPQGPGQLLGCQRKPRAEQSLAFEPCSGTAAAACVQLLLQVCLARAHFCPVGINKICCKLALYWGPRAETQCCVAGASCVILTLLHTRYGRTPGKGGSSSPDLKSH